jgi:hypothetical protein
MRGRLPNASIQNNSGLPQGPTTPPPLPQKLPIAPIFIADSVSLAVSREKDGKLPPDHGVTRARAAAMRTPPKAWVRAPAERGSKIPRGPWVGG